jgi:DNA-binding NarL/FixJ family response regulator
MRISVGVMDDDKPSLVATTRRLEADGRFLPVFASRNARDTIARLMQHRPEVLVSDIHMGDRSFAATWEVFDAANRLGTRIVAFTRLVDYFTLVRAVQHHSSAVVAKDDDDDLLDVVEDAASRRLSERQRQRYLEVGIGDDRHPLVLSKALLEFAQSYQGLPLKPRDLDIIDALVENFAIKAAATKLHFDERTIRDRVKALAAMLAEHRPTGWDGEFDVESRIDTFLPTLLAWFLEQRQ